jgi:fatty acid-binding protein DegV
VSLKPVTHVAVIHAMAPDAEEFAATLKERCELEEVLVATVGSIIGTHAGPRVLGVSLWSHDPLDDFEDERRQ